MVSLLYSVHSVSAVARANVCCFCHCIVYIVHLQQEPTCGGFIHPRVVYIAVLQLGYDVLASALCSLHSVG